MEGYQTNDEGRAEGHGSMPPPPKNPNVDDTRVEVYQQPSARNGHRIGKARERVRTALRLAIIAAVLVLAVGGPASTVYCTPCKNCSNGECAFFRNKVANASDYNDTSCRLDVVFNDEIRTDLERTTLTTRDDCDGTFDDLPADGVVVPCFTKGSGRNPHLYVGSTTDLDPYSEQCPGMVAALALAGFTLVASWCLLEYFYPV